MVVLVVSVKADMTCTKHYTKVVLIECAQTLFKKIAISLMQVTTRE